MITLTHKNNNRLFDATNGYRLIGNDCVIERLNNSWAAAFRDKIYPILPVDLIADLYCPNNGRPTKNLATLLGAILLQEMFNLTDNQILDDITFNTKFHYALRIPNLTAKEIYISKRTLIYFRNKLIESDLPEEIFSELTQKIADAFSVDFSLQRLDSVHIHTNMKQASRLAMMSATVKKFLNSLKKHYPQVFDSLEPELIQRYYQKDKSGFDYFGQVLPKERQSVIVTVAKDMHTIISHCEGLIIDNCTEEYSLLTRVFREQCVVEIKNKVKVTVKDPEDASSTVSFNASNDNPLENDDLEEIDIKLTTKESTNPIEVSVSLPELSHEPTIEESANPIDVSASSPELSHELTTQESANPSDVKDATPNIIIQTIQDNSSSSNDAATTADLEPGISTPGIELEVKMKDPKDVPSDSLQYPTDPDATYNRHKGKGYHVQVVETYTPSSDAEDKPLELIVYAELEGAHQPDSGAVKKVIDDLTRKGIAPEELLADTAYGGDSNCEYARQFGVELVAPVAGSEPGKKASKSKNTQEVASGAEQDLSGATQVPCADVQALSEATKPASDAEPTIAAASEVVIDNEQAPSEAAKSTDDAEQAFAAAAQVAIDEAQTFSFAQQNLAEMALLLTDEELEPQEYGPFKLSDFYSNSQGVIEYCPMGHAVVEQRNADANGCKACFNKTACQNCPRRTDCPVKFTKDYSYLTYRYDQVRIAKRRAYQTTAEFKDRYRWRSGIEGTNSHLARIGLKRLRVRGFKKANLKVKMKALGLNVLRTVAYLRRISKKNEAKA